LLISNFRLVLNFVCNFRLFSGVWFLIADVSEHCVSSIFIGVWQPLAYEDGTDSVPKRRLLNTICRRTTQTFAHDINNFVKMNIKINVFLTIRLTCKCTCRMSAASLSLIKLQWFYKIIYAYFWVQSQIQPLIKCRTRRQIDECRCF
jgi:hypothetical protein